MADLSYYSVLGLKSDASPEEIKSAYRRAARANHPDSGLPGAGALFPLIQEAFDTLGDNGKREAYDRKMAAPKQESRPEPQQNQPAPRPQYTPSRPQTQGESPRPRPREDMRPPMPRQATEPEPPETGRQGQVDRLKKANPKQIAMLAGSALLWVLWVVLCSWIIVGMGQDGIMPAFIGFFLMAGLSFLLVSFLRGFSPVPAFIFASITLPLPVVGLATSGWSSTSLILVIPAVAAVAAAGDVLLRRPAMRSLSAARP